jgi:cephalosporin-C deacetylase-like acetyl esterase
MSSSDKIMAEAKGQWEELLVHYHGFSGGTKARAPDVRKAASAIAELMKALRKQVQEEKAGMVGRKPAGL